MVIGCRTPTILGTLWVQRLLPVRDWPIPQNLKSILIQNDSEILGYTRYTSYLSAGKEAMSGQMKLLTATVTREESTTQTIERVVLPQLSSKLASAPASPSTIARNTRLVDLRPKHLTYALVTKASKYTSKNPNWLPHLP